MADLSLSIQRYITNSLPLSMTDIQASAASRDWFLKRIQNEIDSRYRQPVLLGAEPFVRFGSYFKGTKVADVDEFDILVVIDSCGGQFSQGGSVVGRGAGHASPNHKYTPPFYKNDGSGVSSSKMVRWLQDVVDTIVQAFNGERTEEDGISVKASIKSQSLSLDLVPAGVFDHTVSGKRFYNIGDGSDGWTLTTPRDDIDRVNAVARGKENLKNVIRLAKRIKDQYGLPISSFAIETAITDYAAGSLALLWPLYDLHSNVILCLRHLGEVLAAGQIADPFDSSKNLLDAGRSYGEEAKFFGNVCAFLAECQKMWSQDECDTRIHKAFEAELSNS